MNKKNLIKLADFARVTRARLYREYGDTAQTRGTVAEIISDLVTVCKTSNSAFKEERFRSYIAGECGPNGGKVSA